MKKMQKSPESSTKVVYPERISFLKGQKVYLSPMEISDAQQLQKWINDPEVTRFLQTRYPTTLEQEIEWLKSGNKEQDKLIRLGIVIAENHRFIGNIFLGITSRLSGLATMGYMIGEKDCWSKGYGSDALNLIVEYGFNVLNIRKISATVYDFNPRSKRCMEKCGFKLEGTKIKHEYREGKHIDIHVMTKFRE